MRKVTNIKEVKDVEICKGRLSKIETITINNVIIDNYGTMTSQQFICILLENNRIDYHKYFKNRSKVFSDEILTELLNSNLDLFESKF